VGLDGGWGGGGVAFFIAVIKVHTSATSYNPRWRDFSRGKEKRVILARRPWGCRHENIDLWTRWNGAWTTISVKTITPFGNRIYIWEDNLKAAAAALGPFYAGTLLELYGDHWRRSALPPHLVILAPICRLMPQLPLMYGRCRLSNGSVSESAHSAERQTAREEVLTLLHRLGNYFLRCVTGRMKPRTNQRGGRAPRSPLQTS